MFGVLSKLCRVGLAQPRDPSHAAINAAQRCLEEHHEHAGAKKYANGKTATCIHVHTCVMRMQHMSSIKRVTHVSTHACDGMCLTRIHLPLSLFVAVLYSWSNPVSSPAAASSSSSSHHDAAQHHAATSMASVRQQSESRTHAHA